MLLIEEKVDRDIPIIRENAKIAFQYAERIESEYLEEGIDVKGTLFLLETGTRSGAIIGERNLLFKKTFYLKHKKRAELYTSKGVMIAHDDNDWFRKPIICFELDYPVTKKIIVHEYGHIGLYNKIGLRYDTPTNQALHEGFSCFCARRYFNIPSLSNLGFTCKRLNKNGKRYIEYCSSDDSKKRTPILIIEDSNYFPPPEDIERKKIAWLDFARNKDSNELESYGFYKDVIKEYRYDVGYNFFNYLWDAGEFGKLADMLEFIDRHMPEKEDIVNPLRYLMRFSKLGNF